jgi:clorobiocin biosynthesis protein CloN7
MLDVPGASLYYELQGSGPGLMLVGHPMDTSGFAAVAPLLAEYYTVVTYDPRGFANSTIDDRDQDAEPDLLADDVRRLLEAVGEGPADVFGSSGGAVTGLALVANYPGHVRTLVAHEPPLALLLPDAVKARSGIQAIYDTYRESGVGAAWQKFSSFTGIDMRAPEEEPAPHPGPGPGQRSPSLQPGPPSSSSPSPPSPSPNGVATSERFFGHGLLPIALYQPDFSALQEAPARVIVAGGTTSNGEFAWRTADALAQRLGTPLVDFPGGHGGFVSDAREFAAVLLGTLA